MSGIEVAVVSYTVAGLVTMAPVVFSLYWARKRFKRKNLYAKTLAALAEAEYERFKILAETIEIKYGERKLRSFFIKNHINREDLDNEDSLILYFFKKQIIKSQ